MEINFNLLSFLCQFYSIYLNVIPLLGSSTLWSHCLMLSSLLFFFFSGADIVQWLMKNLSIEDPGKVTIAGEEQILHLYRVCH